MKKQTRKNVVVPSAPVSSEVLRALTPLSNDALRAVSGGGDIQARAFGAGKY